MSYLKWDSGDSAEMLFEGDNTGKIDGNVLLYNKYCATNLNYLRSLQQQGLKIIVDVDDYWQLPDYHPNASEWSKRNHTEQIVEHIKNADLVICTTLALQEQVRNLNKSTVVIPNAFPFGYENYKPMPEPSEKMRFMYVGSMTHYRDVKLLEGRFKRINSLPDIKNNATFILAGYQKAKAKRFMSPYDMKADNDQYIVIETRGPYDKMVSLLKNMPSYDILNSTDQDEYINFYDKCDVSLVPLENNFWNSMKSTLKFAEAGCKQVPVICSNVAPYSELSDYPVMWVNHKDDWINHFRYCIKNPNKVKEMGEQLAERTKHDFDLFKWNEVRKQVITSLCK